MTAIHFIVQRSLESLDSWTESAPYLKDYRGKERKRHPGENSSSPKKEKEKGRIMRVSFSGVQEPVRDSSACGLKSNLH